MPRSWLITIITFVILHSHILTDDTEAIKKIKAVKELVGLLDSDDKKTRMQAYEELIKLDPADALPHLEENLYKSKYALHYELLKKIFTKSTYHPSVSMVSISELNQNLTELEKMCSTQNLRYLISKISKAKDSIGKGKLTDALEIITAIETLESGDINYAARKIKLIIENDIFNQSVLKTSVKPLKKIITEGAPLSFKLMIENLKTDDLKVTFPPNTADNIVMKLNLIEYDIFLNNSVNYFPVTKTSGQSFVVKGGKTWELDIQINELTEIKLNRSLAICNIEIVFYPARIELGGDVTYKKLIFPSDSFLVIHSSDAKLALTPTKTFTELVRTGGIEDVFVSAIICSYSNAESKRFAINEFIEILKSIEDTKKLEMPFNVVRNILTLMTGKALSSKDDWIKWWAMEKSKN